MARNQRTSSLMDHAPQVECTNSLVIKTFQNKSDLLHCFWKASWVWMFRTLVPTHHGISGFYSLYYHLNVFIVVGAFKYCWWTLGCIFCLLVTIIDFLLFFLENSCFMMTLVNFLQALSSAIKISSLWWKHSIVFFTFLIKSHLKKMSSERGVYRSAFSSQDDNFSCSCFDWYPCCEWDKLFWRLLVESIITQEDKFLNSIHLNRW